MEMLFSTGVFKWSKTGLTLLISVIALFNVGCAQTHSCVSNSSGATTTAPVDYDIQVGDGVVIISDNMQGIVSSIDSDTHPEAPFQINIGSYTNPEYIWEPRSNLRRVYFLSLAA
jgi:hypothetical protein